MQETMSQIFVQTIAKILATTRAHKEIRIRTDLGLADSEKTSKF
jgi:hypothetical protein